MSRAGPRVAGIDPGTLSFDVCALAGGEVMLERSFRTADLGADPSPLVETLVEHGPFALVLGQRPLLQPDAGRDPDPPDIVQEPGPAHRRNLPLGQPVVAIIPLA